MPLFRQPVSSDDSAEGWKAPDYFKAESSSGDDKSGGAWSAPDYFTPEKAEKKPSEVGKRLKIAASDFVRDVKSIPSAASKFIDEHPKIREAGARLMSGDVRGQSDLISPEDKAKGSSVQGEELQKIPGLEAAGNWIRNKGINTGNYWAGAGASLLGSLVGSAAVMGDPRAMALKDKPGELPIREKSKDFVSRSSAKPYQLDAEFPEKKPARKLLGPAPDYISGERGIAENRSYDRDTSDPYSIQQKHGGTLTSADIGERTRVSPQIAAQYGLEPRASELPIREPNRLSPEEAIKTLESSKTEETPTQKSKLFNPFEKKSDDLRQRFKDVKEAAIGRTSEEELTKGFGGSGHPESPDYTSKVLEAAGKGEPGLNVEDKEGFKHVVYRDKQGNPVAAAKVVTGPDGKSSIQDLAADKTKGLLTGRAMMHIGDKLQELGATESSGTISADAQNFLDRMKGLPKKARAAQDFAESVQSSEIAPEQPSVRPTAKFAYDWPEAGGKQYNVEGGPYHGSTVGEARLREQGIEIPDSHQSPENANELPIRQNGDQIRAQMLADRKSKLAEFNQAERNKAHIAELEKEEPTKYRKSISEWKPPDYFVKEAKEPTGIGARIKGFLKDEEGSARLPGEEDSEMTEMHGGLGAIGKKTKYPPAQGPNGPVLDKLFQSMLDAKEKNIDQTLSYRQERAKRFASFAGVKDEGETGAAKSLSKLKGQYDKIEPGEGLQMKQEEVDQLFTAVKKARITTGEKARGYTALFKLMNGESVPQRNELAILDNVFGNGFADRITQMHGGLGAVGLKVSKLANTMKSLQNSISLAAPLRHGIGLVARKEFAPAFTEMFKYFAKPEYYQSAMDTLEERPTYILSREAGLFTAKPGSLMNSEEDFLNSYVGAIPLVRETVGASQRAYIGFLNKLRSDTFDSMIKQAKSLGHDVSTTVDDQVIPSRETKAIARYINNATGRGDLGSLNKMTNELNTLLWSPRMISSRINMLANPKIYTDLPKGMRLDGLKSLLGIAALGTVIDTLGAYGGAKVSTNILSSDFGKSRFGTKLIDPWGGFQQYVVGAARFLAGKTDSSSPTSRLEIAGRFLANKESPAASLAHVLLTARKFTGKSDDPATAGNFTSQYGEKTNIQSEIGKRFTPIFIQDLQDLMKNEPDWSENIGLNTAMGVASLAGMSQNYKAPQKGKLRLGSMKIQ